MRCERTADGRESAERQQIPAAEEIAHRGASLAVSFTWGLGPDNDVGASHRMGLLELVPAGMATFAFVLEV